MTLFVNIIKKTLCPQCILTLELSRETYKRKLYTDDLQCAVIVRGIVGPEDDHYRLISEEACQRDCN